MFINRNLIKFYKPNLRSLTLSTNLDFKDRQRCEPILNSFYLFEEFITESEEQSLLDQVDKILKKRRYEDTHFDYAIKQYKEVEFNKWNEKNIEIINRIKTLGFTPEPLLLNSSSHVDKLINESFDQLNELNFKTETDYSSQSITNKFSDQSSKQFVKDKSIEHQSNENSNKNLNKKEINQIQLTNVNAINDIQTRKDKLSNADNLMNDKKKSFKIIPEVHILDLKKDGYIMPHVDAVRFCGSRIIGLSLLSDAIMRLIDVDDKEIVVDALLKRRSLYIMINYSRYNCTHEILADEKSFFRNQKVPRERRVSIITRCLPDKDVEERIIKK